MSYIEFDALNPEVFHSYKPPSSDAFNGQVPFQSEAFNGEVPGIEESNISTKQIINTVAIIGGIGLLVYGGYKYYQYKQNEKKNENQF